MLSRCLIAASAALAIAGSAGAEPAKPTAQPAKDRPAAEVVLASAEQAPAPALLAQNQPATPAKKPRAARVTTCRCAGQTGQDN
jgi:hypothetical protein